MNVEFSENKIDQLAGVHARIEKERGARAAMMQPVQEAIDKGCLAGANFAGKRNKSFASLDTVHQAGQCLLDFFGQEKEPRIGVNVEWIFFEAEIAFIHEAIVFLVNSQAA